VCQFDNDGCSSQFIATGGGNGLLCCVEFGSVAVLCTETGLVRDNKVSVYK